MLSKRLALSTIVITFLLLIWGGVVHNTESSLACPDWPLCYGQFFPKMKGSILIEHGHRLLASLVGLLTIGLVLATRKRGKGEFSHRLAWIALGLVILQGILGGITVIYKLPTIVSTSHLGLSLVFFCTLVLLHDELGKGSTPVLGPGQRIESIRAHYRPQLKAGILLALGMTYAQILLGAFMRHAGAGVACGVGWPNSLACFDSTIWQMRWLPVAHPSQLHMTHRYFAVVVGMVVAVTVYRQLRFLKAAEYLAPQWTRSVRVLSWALIATVAAQIAMGVLTVAWALDPLPTTAHLGGAAILLALLWKLNLRFRLLEDQAFPEGTHTFAGDVLDLTKPKLSALVMVTALIGMLLAPAHVNFFKALWALVLIAMVVAGAGALNCLIEKDIDAKMVRTMNRSLPAGRLPPRIALAFGVLMVALAVPLLVITVNWATGILALVAFVLYLFAYTPMKQKSEMAVYVGAIPGAIPPVLGWTSVMGRIDPMGWALFLILLIWQLPHFLSISIFHSKDYDAAGLKVYPNLQGIKATKWYISLFTAALMGVALLPFYWGVASEVYQISAFVLSGTFLILAFWGLRSFPTDDAQRRWAKTYFWGSIVYLPALLCAMLFFK